MNNIKPYLWGPSVWKSIFSIIAVYPNNPSNDEIQAIIKYFKSIKHLLPCESCRISYTTFLNDQDTNVNNVKNFNSRDNLIYFVFNIRNKVNNKLGISYGITFKYFKLKLDLMICKNNTHYDAYINMLNEAPIITDDVQNKILKELKKNNYNINDTIDKINFVNDFIKNPTFNPDDNKFLIYFKRNSKCRKIMNKIYKNMCDNNWDIEESFKYDRKEHLALFNLGCNIVNVNIIKKYL